MTNAVAAVCLPRQRMPKRAVPSPKYCGPCAAESVDLRFTSGAASNDSRRPLTSFVVLEYGLPPRSSPVSGLCRCPAKEGSRHCMRIISLFLDRPNRALLIEAEFLFAIVGTEVCWALLLSACAVIRVLCWFSARPGESRLDRSGPASLSWGWQDLS